MKCFFQLIEAATGNRTQAYSMSREGFADCLSSRVDDNLLSPDDFVLVVVDNAEAEEWNFSIAPLMRVSSFIANFSTKVTDNV